MSASLSESLLEPLPADPPPGSPGGLVTALVADFEDTGTRVLSAVFHSICDATRAALEVVGMVAGPALPRLRVVLCTAAVDPAGPAGAIALRHAEGLLALARGGQILATAPTAVVAGPTLPPGIDLLDRGLWAPAPGEPAERVYEIRLRDSEVAAAAVSNLDWARRAVHNPGGLLPDLESAVSAASAVWPRVRGGAPGMAVICGGAPTDRAAVTAESALRLHAEGAQVLYGRWASPGPYRAFREALGRYAAGCGTELLRADLAGWVDEIADLLPEVGARIGGARLARGRAPAGRAGLFDAVETWVRAMARRAPTVLVLDDAHRADPESLSLLAHVWHACRAHRVMVVVTVEQRDHVVVDRLTDVAVHPDASALVRVDLG